MAGAVTWLKDGPSTAATVDNLFLGTVNAGIIVEGRTGTTNGLGNVGVAAAGSLKVVGVALQDAVAVANQAAMQTGVTGYGGALIDAFVPTEVVAICNEGQVRVTYTLAANFGDQLIVGTVAGQASPAGATPDARTVIGWCAEPGGVSAGAVGLMKITR